MIRRFLYYHQIINELNTLFYQYGHYLKPGRYVMANEKLIHRDDPETKASLTILFGNEESRYFAQSNKNFKYFLKKLFHQKKMIIRDSNNHHGFEGTVLYLQTSRKGIKVFDFHHKKMLSAYNNTDSFNKHIDSYFYYSRYFTIPPMLMHDPDKKTLIEKLILSKLRSERVKSDEKALFDKICDIYHHYYQTCLREKNYSHSKVETMIHKLKKDSILFETANRLQQRIPDEILGMHCPCVKQHGDLWSANILLDENSNNEIFFIDWEHAGEYFFFFDLFKWIDLEAEKNHNVSYLEHYLNGSYDDYFLKIFEMWGLDFDKSNRKAYYLMYIADYFYNRVLNKDDTRKREVQEKYIVL